MSQLGQDPGQPEISYDPSVFQQPQQSDAPQAPVNAMQAAQAAPGTYQPDRLGQVQAPPQTPQTPPRQRMSFWDVVGRLGNVLANASPNPHPQYQTPLEQQQNLQLAQQKVDAGALDNQAKQQDIAQTSVATAGAANNVLGGFARGIQSLVAANPNANLAVIAPALAHQLNIPPQQAQQLSEFLQQNPGNVDALVDATSGVPKTAAGKSLALAFTNAKDANGNPVLLQASADGTPHVLQGYTPLGDVKVVDNGTTNDVINKQGQVVRSFVKSGSPESGTVAAGTDAQGRPVYQPLPGSARAAGIEKTNTETEKNRQQLQANEQKQADAYKEKAAAYASSQSAIASIRKNIDALKTLRSQPSANQNALGNAVNYFQSSGIGSHVTAVTNPAVQQARDQIKSAGQALLLSAARGNGQLFRNQNEQKNFLDAINNPRSSIETMEEQLRLAQSRLGSAPANPQKAPAASGGWGKVTVKAAILAQHPEAAGAPAARRPTLTINRPAASPQPAPGQNWLQRAGEAINQNARPAAAIYRGIQDAIPGIDNIAAASNELGSLVGLNSSDMPYSDRVRAFRAAREAETAQDIHGPSSASAAGHYLGEVVGLLGGGIGEVKAGTAAIGKIAPRLLKPATSTLGKISKLASAGAASGALSGAANSDTLSNAGTNAAEGAVIGAVAAPAAAGALKLAQAAGSKVADFTGLSKATGILKRYVNTTAEELETRRKAFKARTGANPTLFELLPLADRQAVQKMIGILPGTSKEHAAGLIQQRAANIGQEMSARASAIMQPQRQGVIDNIAQDLANSRMPAGQQGIVSAADRALAERAARDPSVLNDVRRQINRQIMQPHDSQVAAGNVDELVPWALTRAPNGQVQAIETDPDLSSMIRTAAGIQRLDPNGVTVSEVTGMISKLRNVANKSADFNQAETATRAAQHLEQMLPPEARDAFERTSASNQTYKQIAEGWKAGLKSDLRENVDPTGNFQLVRNQYDTPAGAQGRLLGQASAIDQNLAASPGSSLRNVQQIAENPTTQEAISRNLDATQQPVTSAGTAAPGSGQQIADAAQAQTQSAQNLAALNTDKPGPDADLPALASNLMSLAKGRAVQALLNAVKLPESQATQLADALFSQNPSQIQRGIGFLRNAGTAGQDALRGLQGALTASNAAGQTGTAQPPQVPLSPEEEASIANPTGDTGQPGLTGTVSADAPDQGQQQIAEDGSNSPYIGQLNDVFAKGDPRLLELANIVQRKESSDSHFDKDGKVKTSKAGAVGLMQVMPSSLGDIANNAGINNDPAALSNDPAYNKLVGTHYLDQLLTKYGGDRKKAAAAYNAGPGAVDRAIAADPNNWLSKLPAETQSYAGDIN
uniref:Transglycosylase SLT domain-containing protein n=1 Tax=Mycena chlorophos TaxID=658473 RepID=A0ABQ0KXR5_MYCCL|nr:predicted protein [Mycena chlorophos]